MTTNFRILPRENHFLFNDIETETILLKCPIKKLFPIRYYPEKTREKYAQTQTHFRFNNLVDDNVSKHTYRNFYKVVQCYCLAVYRVDHFFLTLAFHQDCHVEFEKLILDEKQYIWNQSLLFFFCLFHIFFNKTQAQNF